MIRDFKIGDKVFFEYDSELKYRRIIKIVATIEGEMAVFDEGCVKDAMKKPLNQIFYNLKELREELIKNG